MADILVVDDSSVDRTLITGLLKQACHGTNVVPVDNGWEALELLQCHSFDLIITDYMMPEINGLQLIQEVGLRGFDIPVILLTGSGNAEIAVRAISAGAANYVPKRLMARFLKSVVNDLLSSVPSRTQLRSAHSEYQNRFSIDNDISLIEPVIAHIQEQIVYHNSHGNEITMVKYSDAWVDEPNTQNDPSVNECRIGECIHTAVRE